MKENKWHAEGIDNVLSQLNTDGKIGLRKEEVEERLRHYGYNELKRQEMVSALSMFSVNSRMPA